MKRKWWLLVSSVVVLVLGIALWQFVFTAPEDAPHETQTSAPTDEELDELTSRLTSQDEEVFLEIWSQEVKTLFSKEEILSLMVPKDSTVTVNGKPSQSGEYWRIDVEIDPPDHKSVRRELFISLQDDQWVVSLGKEVK